MAYLTGKPKASGNWLPTQVLYGVDCSSDNPKDWVAFGKHAEPKATSESKQPKGPTAPPSS